MIAFTMVFRGQAVVVVVDQYDEDPETNGLDVSWHFEGVTPEQHDALSVTDAEEDAIIDAIGLHVHEDD